MVEPKDVVEAMISALDARQFKVLPRPEVTDYMSWRTTDRDRWLDGMRKLRRGLIAANGRAF